MYKNIGFLNDVDFYESDSTVLFTNSKNNLSFKKDNNFKFKNLYNSIKNNSLNEYYLNLCNQEKEICSKVIQILNSKGLLVEGRTIVTEQLPVTVITEKSFQTLLSDALYPIKVNRSLDIEIYKNLRFEGIKNNDQIYIIYLPNYPEFLALLLENYKLFGLTKILIGHEYQGEIWSSYLEPPKTACPKCLLNRLKNNLPTFRYIIENGFKKEKNSNEIDNHLAINLIINSYKSFIQSVRSQTEPQIGGQLLTINKSTLKIDTERIIKLNECDCYNSFTLSRRNNLKKREEVGKNVGLIKQVGAVKLLTSDPKIVYLSGYTNSFKKISGGAVDLDYKNAFDRTVGECIERYSWFNPLLQEKKLDCWNNIPISNRVNLSSFNFYSQEQYAKVKFPFKELKNNDITEWVKMNHLNSTKEIYVPVNILLGSENIGPRLRARRTNGIAASTSFNQALKSSVLELIERDSISRAWITKEKINKLFVPDIFNIISYQKCREVNLDMEFYIVDNVYKIPIIICKLYSNTDNIIAFGCSAGLNFSKTIEKAILEAVQMRIYLRDTKNNHNGYDFFKEGKYNENFLDSLDIIEKKTEGTIDVCFNIEDISDIFYCDITPEDVSILGYFVIQVWSPNKISFVKNNNELPITLFPNLQNLNKIPQPFI